MQCAPNLGLICVNIKMKRIALLNLDFFFFKGVPKGGLGGSDRKKREQTQAIIKITSINTKCINKAFNEQSINES